MRKRLMGFVIDHLQGKKTVRDGRSRQQRLSRYLSAEEGVECTEDGDLSICIHGWCIRALNGESPRVSQGAVSVEMEEDELLEGFRHGGDVMSRRDDMNWRDLSYGLNCRQPSSILTNQDYDDAMCKCNRPDLHMLLRACPPPPSLFSPLSSTMASLSPPPMRHRASSTNLRPALTISTLGPRPKACAYLESIPATPQATADTRKVAPSLASPSRLSTLIERCVALLHVYSHLPPYSSPSTPVSPS